MLLFNVPENYLCRTLDSGTERVFIYNVHGAILATTGAYCRIHNGILFVEIFSGAAEIDEVNTPFNSAFVSDPQRLVEETSFKLCN